MLIRTSKYVPKVYQSRDYKAFLTMLDIVLSTSKYEIDNLLSLYDPETCPSNLLPYLAHLVGYVYNYTDSIQENRNIIKNFNAMIRNRGSETGITLAAALSLSGSDNKDFISDLEYLSIMINYEKGLIEILYPREKTKVRNLLDWVRPVGMYIDLTPGTVAGSKDTITVNDNVKVNVQPYSTILHSGVEWDSINFSRLYINLGTTIKTWQDMLDNEITWQVANETALMWESFLEE